MRTKKKRVETWRSCEGREMIGAIRKTWVENFIGRRTEKRNLNNEKSRCRRRCMLGHWLWITETLSASIYFIYRSYLLYNIYVYIFIYIHIGLERIPPIGWRDRNANWESEETLVDGFEGTKSDRQIDVRIFQSKASRIGALFESLGF